MKLPRFRRDGGGRGSKERMRNGSLIPEYRKLKRYFDEISSYVRCRSLFLPLARMLDRLAFVFEQPKRIPKRRQKLHSYNGKRYMVQIMAPKRLLLLRFQVGAKRGRKWGERSGCLRRWSEVGDILQKGSQSTSQIHEIESY